MGFTYDIGLADDVSKVRLELGDEVCGNGIKPDGGNFDDSELSYWLTREGSVMRAVAAACEALARSWSKVATLSVGPRREELSQVARSWADRAKELRRQYGGDAMAFSAGLVRQDGYSNDVPSDAVTETTEYGR